MGTESWKFLLDNDLGFPVSKAVIKMVMSLTVTHLSFLELHHLHNFKGVAALKEAPDNIPSDY